MHFLKLLKYLLVAVLISLAGFGGAACAIYLLLPGFSDRLPLARPAPAPTHTDQLPPETAQVVITDQDAIVDAVRRVMPSVVTVCDGRARRSEGGRPAADVSGFLMDSRGYVVTSAHAVADFRSFEVVLQDDRRLGGELIGSHRGADIAVLKIAGDDEFPAAILGDSHLLQAGEWVVSLGSATPQFEQTVTVGVVGARARPTAAEGRGFDNLIQTSVVMAASNTGGPLVNLNGEVVGVCTNAYASAPDAAGLGFAVSVEDAFALVDEMIRNGRSHRAYLGLSVDDVSEEDAQLLGLRSRSGALVRGVVAGGPAAKSGLERHDVIVRFDDQRVHSADGFMRLARQRSAGDEVRLEFLRNGERLSERVRIEERD